MQNKILIKVLISHCFSIVSKMSFGVDLINMAQMFHYLLLIFFYADIVFMIKNTASLADIKLLT